MCGRALWLVFIIGRSYDRILQRSANAERLLNRTGHLFKEMLLDIFCKEMIGNTNSQHVAFIAYELYGREPRPKFLFGNASFKDGEENLPLVLLMGVTHYVYLPSV